MKQTKHLLLLLLAFILSVTNTFAQGEGTTFEVGNVTYYITKNDLTPGHLNNEVEIWKVGGSGVVTIPAKVTHPQNSEIYNVVGTRGWMEGSPKVVTKIILPEGLTKISVGGFSNSEGLTEIVIPSTCTEIEPSCFTFSSKLKKFEVAAANPNFKHNDNGWLLNKTGNKLVYLPKGWEGEVDVPSTITSIAPSGMFRCPKVKVVKLPSTFVNNEGTLDYPSFACTATRFVVAPENPAFKDIDGVLFNKNGTDLIAFPVEYYKSPAPSENWQDPRFKYTLPTSAKTICSNAFFGTFNYPKTLDLNNVEKLEDKALQQMWGLKQITIGAFVKEIGKGALTGCTSLIAIKVNPANSKYKDDDGVLYTKDGEHLMQFPTKKTGDYAVLIGTKFIDDEAFREVDNTGVVTLSSSVENIGKSSFRTAKFSKIIIPDDSRLKEIDEFAFDNFEMTGTLKLPATLEKLGVQAFGSSKLTEIRFAAGVQLESISYDCFNGMPNLERVVFEGNAPRLTTIHSRAFMNCPKLKTVDIPQNVTQIETSVFVNTPMLETVIFKTPSSLKTIGKSTFSKSGIRHIELPNSVTKIEEQAFDNCANLTTVKVPASVTEIKTGAFNFCENLTAINVEAGNTKYASLDGMLCSKDKKTLVTFPAGKADSKYTLIPYFDTVGEYAFYSSNKVSNITFPKSVVNIEDRSLALCKNIKSLSFMGEENVPELKTDILFNSSNPQDINIYVRKDWYDKTENAATIQKYDNIFKHVIPSFYAKEVVGGKNYDRGVEFFQTSDNNVGVISFEDEHERTSVIIDKEAVQPAFTSKSGVAIPEATYSVSSVLDFAFEEKSTPNPSGKNVKAIVFLSEIGSIGLKAFKRSSIEQLFFVGNAPGDLTYDNYELPNDYPFKENQKIYVKRTKVNSYQTAWQTTEHTLGITHEIPQTTHSYGATRCYPFDVQYDNDGDVRPYLPVDFSRMTPAYPYARARRIDNGYVPAFLGVLLHSRNAASATSYCEMTDAQDHHAVNDPSGKYSAATYKMVGVVEDTQVMSDANNNLYAFSKSKGQFLKIKQAPGNTMPYFSAYLKLDSNNQAKGFSFRFDDDDPSTTGIENIEIAEDANDSAPYYNLNGMRVNNPAKGVYIHNGKKVIIK